MPSCTLPTCKRKIMASCSYAICEIRSRKFQSSPQKIHLHRTWMISLKCLLSRASFINYFFLSLSLLSPQKTTMREEKGETWTAVVGPLSDSILTSRRKHTTECKVGWGGGWLRDNDSLHSFLFSASCCLVNNMKPLYFGCGVLVLFLYSP